MPLTSAALKTELQTDPSALGYAALLAAGDHAGVAAALNLVRAGITVKRDIVDSYEIFEAIVPAEFTALSAGERQRLQLLLGMGKVNVKGNNTRAQFSTMFAAGSATRTAILALIDRQGSRAEELFGAGINVRASDIALALA